MIEFLIVAGFLGYMYYLRNYADLRTKSEKEEYNLKEGISLFHNDQIQPAFDFFDQRIKVRPNSAVAYLYRALCYKAQGQFEAAMEDVNTGLSYDESVYKLHLEKGKLQFRIGLYEPALKALNKAVFNAGEQDPEPYYWRAMTKQQLHQHDEAQKDYEKEAIIIEARNKEILSDEPEKKPYWNSKIIANFILVICSSVLLIFIIKKAESIHLPYLMAAFSAIALGFAEPHKGWLLAIAQNMLVFAGYFLFTKLPVNGGKIELENFSLYGSAILIFAGSFLGAFIKRAISG